MMRKAKTRKTEKTFREEYDRRNRIKTANECSWFCIVWGLILFFACGYQAICTQGLLNAMYIIIALIGLLLLVFGTAAPLKMQKGVAFVKSVFSVFGNAVLKGILLPVYFVLMLINACNHKKYTQKFGFKNWDACNHTDTAYFDFNRFDANKHKHTPLRTGIDVLTFFAGNGMYVVIPIVIILLILGIVMFFVSTGAVFSFVYTLF